MVPPVPPPPAPIGAESQVKFRTGGPDFKDRGNRFKKVDEDQVDTFKCDYGSAYEERIHIVGECPYMKKREKSK